MKQYLLSAFAIVALLFAACGGGDDAPTTIPVSGIKLDKSSLSLEIGEKATLSATIAPSDATNKSITWSSANSSIATVNNGVVEGVATGETTITAKTNDGGFTATITVKVTTKAVKVSQIKLEGMPSEIKVVGYNTTIAAEITPNDATDKSVTFTSSNPEVATVEYTKTEDNFSLAKLTAVGAGKATITVAANDGSGVKASATITVVRAMPTSVTFDGKAGISEENIFLTWHGKVVDLKAAVEPNDVPLKSLIWGLDGATYDCSPVWDYDITDDKATISVVISKNEQYPQDVRATLSAKLSENSMPLAKAIIVSRCCFWGYRNFSEGNISNAFDILHFGPEFYHENEYFRWDTTGDRQFKNGWYFVGFCPPISKSLMSSSELYYKDSYIPADEYTLTSSSKNIKITKMGNVCYKVERTNWTTYEDFTLTYTCGEYVYDIPGKLIP